MSGQRFISRIPTAFPNGSVGWAPGGPMDSLGPYAKVQRCPLHRLTPQGLEDTGIRRTCYAQGHANTWFSVPARCSLNGGTVHGYLTMEGGSAIFVIYTHQ